MPRIDTSASSGSRALPASGSRLVPYSERDVLPRPSTHSEPPQARSRRRDEIPDRFKWNLNDIFRELGRTGKRRYKKLEAGIDRYAALKGTLRRGPTRLLDAFRLSEELGQLAYRVWYYPSLQYDQDQRDNTVNARRQQVQILFARWKQAESWFNPELLQIPLDTRAPVDGRRTPTLADLPVRDRGSLSAAGARARRSGRAPDVALQPAGRRRPTTPTGRSRRPTRSSRR